MRTELSHFIMGLVVVFLSSCSSSGSTTYFTDTKLGTDSNSKFVDDRSQDYLQNDPLFFNKPDAAKKAAEYDNWYENGALNTAK